MNIVLDKQSDTFGILKVQLVEEDYKSAIEKKLKDYKKNANMKGFRPGMVPMDLIKKLYGKSVLIDEINHKLGHAVNDYIKENKLPIVGDPLPERESGDNIDWDTQKEFDFSYEIGLSGDFDIDFAKLKAIDSYEIKAEDKDLEDTLQNLKKQFGEQGHPETVVADAMVFGKFTLGDWVEKSAIPMKAIKESEKKLFLGSKVGDTLSFDIQSVFIDTKSLALATGKKEAEAAELAGDVNFVIEDITASADAEMNQDFFDKVLGKDKATDEASFRTQVMEIIESNYKRETEYLLKIDAEKSLVEAINIDLPNEFLRKWLIEVNTGKFTEEQVDQDFENVKKDIRWSLIKNKIAEIAEVKVEYPEVLERTKEMVRGQFGYYDSAMDEVIEKVANNYLTEKKDSEGQDRFMQMYNEVFANKVSNAIVERVKVNKKIVNVDTFKEIAQAAK